MSKSLYLNLPVADLPRAMAFYQALGFAEDPQLASESGGCVVISDTIFLMMCTHDRFRAFTPKAVCDTSQAVEALFNLRCADREEVDALVAKALAAGGSTYDQPEDLGLMYSHSFVDPDGHGWGLFSLANAAEQA